MDETDPLTNDVALLSAVSNLTSADVTLDTAGRDCSFKSDHICLRPGNSICDTKSVPVWHLMTFFGIYENAFACYLEVGANG